MKVFISYRRQDSGALADALYQRLSKELGSRNVYKDMQSRVGGEDFPAAIEAALASSELVFVLLGPSWLHISNPHGGRRIDDRHDYVRLEVATALRRGVAVVPVRVEDAPMPSGSELPLDVSMIVRLNGLPLRTTALKRDLDALVATATSRRERKLRADRLTYRRAPPELHGSWVSASGGNAILTYDFYPDGTYEHVGIVVQPRPTGQFLFEHRHAGEARVEPGRLRLVPTRAVATRKDPESPWADVVDQPRPLDEHDIRWVLRGRGPGAALTMAEGSLPPVVYLRPR